MNHLHFDTLPSTQEYLLGEPLIHNEDALISCNFQSAGLGQYGRVWDSYPSSVCFSFTLNPNSVLTLTSLEISVLISQFIEEKYNISLSLKWPNDLLTNQRQKCGGILLNKVQTERIVCGVGINILPENQTTEYKFEMGSILKDNKTSFSKKDIALDIYTYILTNRLSSSDVLNLWKNKCAHLNQKIHIKTDEEIISGIFTGIGPSGEAHVNSEGKKMSFFSGSLSF